jgi:serine/threonine protein kinase
VRGPLTASRAELPAIPGVVNLTLIGTGGSGLVYRGRQEALSRDVAVKLLASAPATSGSVDRWHRELDAMGRLSNHPNIVAVYDSGLTDNGRPYLVMPFVPGGTLGDRVRASGPLTVEEATSIGMKIANALAAAHAAGVLHRDVKPDNVLLSPYEPQLADFGIARLVDTTTTAATAVGMIHATINYAAPEVLAGEPASEASDVYGLAATVYTALTGVVPFPHAPDANAIAVAHQIIHEPVPSLDDVVPRAIAEVITRAMAKDPADRPSSAEDFAAELGSALSTHGGDTDEELTLPVAPVDATVRDAAAVRPNAIPTNRGPAPRRPIAQRPAPVAAEPGRRRAAVLLVPLVALVAAALFFITSRDNSPTSTSNATATTAAVSTPAAKTATTARRSQAAPRGAVAETAQHYFTLLSQGDYGGAYDMLSPAFQASQSQASFERFWRSVSPVTITGPATTHGFTASVPIRMGSRAENYVLSLARGSGNTLYIDGPRPR